LSEKEMLSLVERLVEEEKRYAEDLKSVASKIKHPVLRALLEGIAMDSLKHSQYYKAIAEYLKGTPFLSEEELRMISEVIERHIEEESHGIKEAAEMLEKASDPRLKLLFAAILEDEKRHHALLVDIRDKIAKHETVTEDDLWDAIWRDSPFHGTPG